MIQYLHQNLKNFFLTSEARLMFQEAQAPATTPPSAHVALEAPPAAPAPAPTQPPVTLAAPPPAPGSAQAAQPRPAVEASVVPVERPETNDRPERAKGLRDLTSAERLLQEQQVSELPNLVGEIFRDIEEKLHIPPEGPKHGSFEDVKQEVLEQVEQSSAGLREWLITAPEDVTFRLSGQLHGHLLFENAIAPDLPPEERLLRLNAFADVIEVTGKTTIISAEIQNTFRGILKNYFGALLPLFGDIDLIERRETVARLPEAVRTVYTQIAGNPEYAINLSDSRILLDQFPETIPADPKYGLPVILGAREAVRQYRELRARVVREAAATTHSPSGAEAPPGSPAAAHAGGTGEGTRRSAERDTTKFLKMIAILFRIAFGEGDPKMLFEQMDEIMGGRAPHEQPREITEAQGKLFDGNDKYDAVRDTSGLHISRTSPFAVKMPTAGRLASVRTNDHKETIIVVELPDNITQLSFVLPEGTSLHSRLDDFRNTPPAGGRDVILPQGLILTSSTASVRLGITKRNIILNASDIAQFYANSITLQPEPAAETSAHAGAQTLQEQAEDPLRPLEVSPTTNEARIAEANRFGSEFMSKRIERSQSLRSDTPTIFQDTMRDLYTGLIEKFNALTAQPTEANYRVFYSAAREVTPKMDAVLRYVELKKALSGLGIQIPNSINGIITRLEQSDQSGTISRNDIVHLVSEMEIRFRTENLSPPARVASPDAFRIPSVASVPVAPAPAEARRRQETPNRLRASISRNIARVNEKMGQIQWDNVPNSEIIRPNAQAMLINLEGQNADLSMSTDARALRALLRDVRRLSALLNRYPRA